MIVIGEVLAAVFIVLGTVVNLLSAIGTLRFPDVYTRSHAASKSSAVGVLCVLLGTFLYFATAHGYISIRLILGIFFVFLTAPVAAHAVCRAAYRSGVKLAGDNPRDDLKNVIFINKESTSDMQ
ncbi:MAG: Na+/H+ antiporter subunit G [Clostridia bacterium]|jgi:multicomponent Na+:H+ antiporter subunit G|nr:Na+/H+ antiporter subunit G [Clostridia bacterium]